MVADYTLFVHHYEPLKQNLLSAGCHRVNGLEQPTFTVTDTAAESAAGGPYVSNFASYCDSCLKGCPTTNLLCVASTESFGHRVLFFGRREQLAKTLLDSSLLQLMSQAFDKLFRPLQEVGQGLSILLCCFCCSTLTKILAGTHLPGLQGATNQQLEHAIMVLLQTLEDLTRAQYKGTTELPSFHKRYCQPWLAYSRQLAV